MRHSAMRHRPDRLTEPLLERARLPPVLTGGPAQYVGAGQQLAGVLRQWGGALGSVALVVGVECEPGNVALLILHFIRPTGEVDMLP